MQPSPETLNLKKSFSGILFSENNALFGKALSVLNATIIPQQEQHLQPQVQFYPSHSHGLQLHQTAARM